MKFYAMKRRLLIYSLLALLSFALSAAPSDAAVARPAEEIWKSLEKLPPGEREKKLIEGARSEGEMVWYTNSGIENATRYIQAFRKNYPFINANFWRAKTRQVTQRVVSEANAGRNLVDVVKPSTDLLPAMLEKNLIGRYDSPLRSVYPAHAKSAYYTNMNYAFRVFAFNPRKVNRKDAPKSWDDLLQPKWKGEILFDESSLEEVMALLAAWGKEKTVNYFTKLSQQQLLIRVGRDTTTQMMMAGEAALAVTTYAYNNEGLRAQNAPVDWVAEDLIPALIYPLTMARNAPHPYSAALFYDFLISEEGQRLIAKEGRVVAHPKVEPIYPRMKELQSFLGTPRIQLNSLEQNHKYYKEGIQILDEIVLKRK
ncbi:MAG TPA: extracellular solute-binding protein [Candidatus Binatia bacterium]|nr:extracellular solute-binding protein [Candidatus Binatia bacterium]